MPFERCISSEDKEGDYFMKNFGAKRKHRIKETR